MVKERYCSPEVSKLLKEKGFNEKVICYYDDGGSLKLNKFAEFQCCNQGYGSSVFAAPTQSMAMDWLREVHKISIEITSTGYLIDDDVKWECDIKAGHRLYFRCITNEKSFKTCADAAIKYCLENLI